MYHSRKHYNRKTHFIAIAPSSRQARLLLQSQQHFTHSASLRLNGTPLAFHQDIHTANQSSHHKTCGYVKIEFSYISEEFTKLRSYTYGKKAVMGQKHPQHSKNHFAHNRMHGTQPKTT